MCFVHPEKCNEGEERGGGGVCVGGEGVGGGVGGLQGQRVHHQVLRITSISAQPTHHVGAAATDSQPDTQSTTV